MNQMVCLFRCGDGSAASGVLRKHRVKDLVVQVEALYHAPTTTESAVPSEAKLNDTPSPKRNAPAGAAAMAGAGISTSTIATCPTAEPRVEVVGGATRLDEDDVGRKEISPSDATAVGSAISESGASEAGGEGGSGDFRKVGRHESESKGYLKIEEQTVDPSSPPMAIPDGTGKKGFLKTGRGAIGGFSGALSPPKMSMMANPFRRAVDRFNGAMSSAENAIVRTASAFAEPNVSKATDIVGELGGNALSNAADETVGDGDEDGNVVEENALSEEGAALEIHDVGGSGGLSVASVSSGGGGGVLPQPGVE